MASHLIERLQRLLALTASPNENEARNAAQLLARLIREHGVVLALPRVPTPPKGGGTPKHPTPTKKKSSGSKRRGVRRVADPPARITSPLGGECIACGLRYRAGQQVLWFASGGGMHPQCFEDWMNSRK